MNNINKYDDFTLIKFLKEENNIASEAFNEIWNRYSNNIKRYCVFKTNNNHYSTDEIFQNTWVSFYNIVKRNDLKITNLKSYLLMTAFHEYTKMKKLENNVIYKNFDFEESNENFVINIENSELMTMIIEATSQLDDETRDCFILHWIEGLNFTEISYILNIPIETIKKRTYRSYEKLKKILLPVVNEINKVK